MEELIRKLEASTEGSRDLDWFIGKAVGVIPVAWIDTHRSADYLSYTTSIDAALTLVPERALWKINYLLNIEDGTFMRPEGEPETTFTAGIGVGEVAPASWYYSKSLGSSALALCIAALKARMAVAVEHIGKAR